MDKCRCKKYILTTNYCPDCGENQTTKPNVYAVDGKTLVNHSLAKKTNQFREPKKGEYYLSGAIPIAYKAFNDLSDKFWIAEII